MDISEKIIRAKEDYDAVYEAGKQAEYDFFWDAFQQNGERTIYYYGFAYRHWADELFKPKYPLDDITIAQSMFYNSGITTVPRLSLNVGNISSMFGASAVRWVDGIVFQQEITNANAFTSATKLEHCPIESGVIGATVNASACPFDKVTIVSFINALSTTTSGQTITFNLSAVNKAFETGEGSNDGSTSAEWQALIGTKPNWTVELA